MIVRMSKIEIVGPKECLLEVLALLRETGLFQFEGGVQGLTTGERGLHTLVLNEKTLTERIFYEHLHRTIDDLLACLPEYPGRESFLEPLGVIDAIAALAERHLAHCSEISRSKEALHRERAELERLAAFLDTLDTLAAGIGTRSSLEFIGVALREEGGLERVVRLLADLTGGRFEIATDRAADGTIVALIAVSRELAEPVAHALGNARIPDLALPHQLGDLPFPERVRRLKLRLATLPAEIEAAELELTRFTQRWKGIYLRVRAWLDERLALLRSMAVVHETRMCFFILGWLPSDDVPRVRAGLNGRFGGTVIVEEKKILEPDLERVPVVLRNPPYFRPFELFVRLLPLPRYTSYDPTPFIAIFFPIFFGMMLGDAGHGLVLLLAALVLSRVAGPRQNIADAARILIVSSLYAVIFGILFGEYFGDAGASFLGLKPLLVERRTSIMPMLVFTLSLGTAHILVGLTLGLTTAIIRHTPREAIVKLLNILAILAIVVLGISLFAPLSRHLILAVAITVAVIVPLLALTGGLLAPLELIKTVGNIVSYTRIMAIGLTSVYLAAVANRLAGMTGDIVTGTVVAGLLHAFNIIIGVFAPTVHALRLHYVEFFSKFLEQGGRKFEPFHKDD